jgi:hypothetical protein
VVKIWSEHPNSSVRRRRILFLLWGHLLRALQLQVGAEAWLVLYPSSLCEILVRVFVCFLSHLARICASWASQLKYGFPRLGANHTALTPLARFHHPRQHAYTSAAPCAMFQPYIRSPCLLLCSLFLFTSAVNALHFYLDANEKRCFIEELPTDTVVEGQHCQRVILFSTSLM